MNVNKQRKLQQNMPSHLEGIRCNERENGFFSTCVIHRVAQANGQSPVNVVNKVRGTEGD